VHRASALLAASDEDAHAERTRAVEALAAGEARLDNAWALRELHHHRPSATDSAPARALAGLTPRVLEVTLLVADGLRDREIAARLHLSPRTVHRHVAAALASTGARNRVELANIARAGTGQGPDDGESGADAGARSAPGAQAS
jgi:DNA-binding NarL/FixJ family response regulator